MNEKLLEDYKDVKEPIFILGEDKVIIETVNELNNTIYIVEDSKGERSVKLYNEVKQSKLPNRDIIISRFNEKLESLRGNISRSRENKQIVENSI